MNFIKILKIVFLLFFFIQLRVYASGENEVKKSLENYRPVGQFEADQQREQVSSAKFLRTEWASN